MICPAIRVQVAAAQSALALGAVLVLAGCGVLFEAPAPANSETATSTPDPGISRDDAIPAGWWEGRDRVRFTVDLPPQWNDFTQEYLDSRDEPVLAAVWSTGETSSGTEPFATVSAFGLGSDIDPRVAVDESLEQWSSSMVDTVRGPRGYVEAATGAVTYWASVTGQMDGEQVTFFKANAFHGPYVVNLIVETTRGLDDPDALELLDALSTLEIAGPFPIEGRQGPPNGGGDRWISYCEFVSVSAQEDWEYTFTPDMDATLWNCPEPTDYVGAWLVTREDIEYDVVVGFRVGTDVRSTREASSTHGAPGEAFETANGYVIAVGSEAEVALGNGLVATRIDVTTTTPSGFESHSVGYYVELGSAGTVEVLVGDVANSANPETSWIEPFLASLEPGAAS